MALPLRPAAGLPLVLPPEPPVDEPVEHPVDCDHHARRPSNRAGRSRCTRASDTGPGWAIDEAVVMLSSLPSCGAMSPMPAPHRATCYLLPATPGLSEPDALAHVLPCCWLSTLTFHVACGAAPSALWQVTSCLPWSLGRHAGPRNSIRPAVIRMFRRCPNPKYPLRQSEYRHKGNFREGIMSRR